MIVRKISGLIILWREMPDDFNAVSSKFSPKFPKVINEDNKIARGKARGTRPADV